MSAPVFVSFPWLGVHLRFPALTYEAFLNLCWDHATLRLYHPGSHRIVSWSPQLLISTPSLLESQNNFDTTYNYKILHGLQILGLCVETMVCEECLVHINGHASLHYSQLNTVRTR